MLSHFARKSIILILFIFYLPSLVFAQKAQEKAKPSIMVIPSKDKVFIFAPDLPDEKYSGFNIYRADKINAEALHKKLQELSNKENEEFAEKLKNLTCTPSKETIEKLRKEIFEGITEENVKDFNEDEIKAKEEIMAKRLEEEEADCRGQQDKMFTEHQEKLKGFQTEYENKIKNEKEGKLSFIKISEKTVTPIKDANKVKTLLGDNFIKLASLMGVDTPEKFVATLKKR